MTPTISNGVKIRTFLSTVLFFTVLSSASVAYSAEKPSEVFYTVKRVVDVDTVILSTGEKVRLIGIDTPESRYNKKLKRDAEKMRKDMDTILALGKRSAQFTRSLTEGKKVRLEFDVEKKDRYGRLLAYLYVLVCKNCDTLRRIDYEYSVLEESPSEKDNDLGGTGTYIFLNATIIKAGYAMVMTVPPNVKYKDLFVKLQKEARDAERGIWRTTPIKTRGKNAG